MSTPFRHPRLGASRRTARAGFSLTEILIVVGIMTVLAASLVVLVPRMRTSAMAKAAAADIQHLSIALTDFRNDKGFYPDRPYTFDGNGPDPVVQGDCIDYVLFKSLTDPDYPAGGKGWAMARTDWEFVRGDALAQQQFVDPWGTPYYYIPYTSYLIGVRVFDPTDFTPAVDGSTALPNCFGTTPPWDDFRDPSDMGRRYPNPAALQQSFYNATTFQIHSKGPDQRTDIYSNLAGSTKPATVIDACDRGQDPDDINNFGGGHGSR